MLHVFNSFALYKYLLYGKLVERSFIMKMLMFTQRTAKPKKQALEGNLLYIRLSQHSGEKIIKNRITKPEACE